MTTVFGIPIHPTSGVPEGVDCCSRCWRKVPVADRLKLVMAMRDRQQGGILSIAAEMATEAILERRSEN